MNNSESTPRYIVGIGASAGGLEALQKLLSSLPSNTGFPYVIVQHLSPDYKSLLGEILGKYTDMPVIQAEEGMKIEEDKVYIIQPGKNMRLSGGKLHLSDQVPKELNLPIDLFFRSLAEEAAANAIAIVLSGTGSDGTNGIKAIKENDGLVIVQDLESSKFDGMPRSVMRTGLADAQLSPEEIALELEHISGTAGQVSHSRSEQEIDNELMRKVYTILKKVSNVNFTHYKQTTIVRRMERRMMLTHKDKLSDYVDFLYESPEEVRTLSKEVLIGVTSFFRDPDFFQCLKDKAISEILSASIPEEPVRVWVAGCSTGEEAYSIAILISEAMEEMKIRRDVKIFATDLDVEAINTAGKGVYGDNIVDSVSTVRLSKYFTRRNNTYTINRDIRKMIVFSPHNVFQDPPFGRLDLVSCRNMLIYFQPVLQNDLFAIFHASIKDNGFLFLGKSEAIGAYTEAFPVMDAAAKIFRHRTDAKIPGAKKVPYLQTCYLDDELSSEGDAGLPHTMSGAKRTGDNGALIDSGILEKFLPACLVINEKNELVHSYGQGANYVHLPLGRYSNKLFDIITEGLKIPVSTLLKECREKKKEVQYNDICFEGERGKSVINLTITPVSSVSEGEGLLAIVFSEKGELSDEENADSVPYEIDRVASQRITDLEQDLAEVQSKLDRSVAEQECVNEELQAANEELLTANEELQSSNEELQSVNEELYTVNSEYQQKLTELSDLNDDIANFLSSTLTGIIFVDNKLNIRRYTDYVTSEFSVMDHDIGRSLAFISYHFPSVDITEICTNVLKTLVPDEREVATSNNKMFFMRVAPYRSTENKILGCVITLVDITSQKQSQVILQKTEKQLTMAREASDAKSGYLSRISHEIKAPMTEIAAQLKTAMKEAESNDALTRSIGKISDTVSYMTSLVTDISEASISERASSEGEIAPFSVADAAQSVRNEALERGGAKVDVELDESLEPYYLGNRQMLCQVISSFVSFSQSRSGDNGKISLSALDESEGDATAKLCFVIKDNAPAIEEKEKALLFKPFADESEGNIGLGLSVAYNNIGSMDGDVSVDSLKNGNTYTIHIRLERYSPEKEKDKILKPKVKLGEEKSSALSGCRALIAEDNSLNRTILASLLANEGMSYVEAVDGEEALRAFIDSPEGTFDCVLMDMRMPQLDGIKATERIRSSGKADAKTVPIIGVSANGFEDDIKQARYAGIDEYVTKPIDRDKLLRAISRLIRRTK